MSSLYLSEYYIFMGKLPGFCWCDRILFLESAENLKLPSSSLFFYGMNSLYLFSKNEKVICIFFLVINLSNDWYCMWISLLLSETGPNWPFFGLSRKWAFLVFFKLVLRHWLLQKAFNVVDQRKMGLPMAKNFVGLNRSRGPVEWKLILGWNRSRFFKILFLFFSSYSSNKFWPLEYMFSLINIKNFIFIIINIF